MARQLTPEALRFIQLHYGDLPGGEDYEDAETIVEGRPLYESALTLVEPRPALYVVPDTLPEPEEEALLDAWLVREVAECAVPATLSRWERLVAALRRWLAGG